MSARLHRGPTRVAVAATSPLAVEAGLRLAVSGGNAVDAAIAATLVATVTEPGVVSLAGGAFVTIDPADGSAPVTVDGNVEMPGRGQPPERFGTGMTEVETAYGGGLRLWIGPGSVATPGALAGLGLAHQRYGAAPWPEVVAPADRGRPAGLSTRLRVGQLSGPGPRHRLRLGRRIRCSAAASGRSADPGREN